jgi:hypothetical protein
MLATDYPDEPGCNPIDLVEQVADGREWAFDRRSEAEMAVEIPGQWCDYGLYFAWSEELSAMHFSCAFDVRVPSTARAQIYELLAHLNQKLWLGHFALWMEEGVPMFRHTLQMPDGLSSRPAVEELIELAIAECERFYPAFQFVIWGGKSAQDAIQAAMFETMGQA